MRKYDKNTIAAAFSTVARLVREGQPVVLGKVEGLNSTNQVWFRAAVTHNFNEKDHGVSLQRIFIVDEKNPQQWRRNTGAKDNPKDIELVDRIMQAMTVVARLHNSKKLQKLQMPKVGAVKVETPKEETPAEVLLPKWAKLPYDPNQLTDEELDNAILETSAVITELNRVKEGRLAYRAKKAELLKTVQELLAGEGFTLEDLIGLV